MAAVCCRAPSPPNTQPVAAVTSHARFSLAGLPRWGCPRERTRPGPGPGSGGGGLHCSGGQLPNPQRVVGMERLGGSPPHHHHLVLHPVLMRSRHRALPCPWGPATWPAAGSGSVRQPRQPANCFHTLADGAVVARTMSRPFLPTGMLLSQGLAHPSAAAASTSADRRRSLPWDPTRSGGQQGCSQSSIVPGAAPAPGHGSPMACLDSPSRRRWGLLLKAVPAPTAPEGFNSSGSRFHNPAKPPQAARAWGDLGGSLLKLRASRPPLAWGAKLRCRTDPAETVLGAA